MYAALGRRDVDVLHAICDHIGYKSKYGKKAIIHKMMQFGYDSFGPEVLGDKNVMQFSDEMSLEDPWVRRHHHRHRWPLAADSLALPICHTFPSSSYSRQPLKLTRQETFETAPAAELNASSLLVTGCTALHATRRNARRKRCLTIGSWRSSSPSDCGRWPWR
jgi:hypothetical protein